MRTLNKKYVDMELIRDALPFSDRIVFTLFKTFLEAVKELVEIIAQVELEFNEIFEGGKE